MLPASILAEGPYGQAMCPVPQRSPVEHTELPAAVTKIKDPLKERSNASFEKHSALLQAEKGDVSQRRRKEKKKRCLSYQSGARICESLGNQRKAGYPKDWSEGCCLFFLWDTEALGQSVAQSGAKCPRRVCLGSWQRVGWSSTMFTAASDS